MRRLFNLWQPALHRLPIDSASSKGTGDLKTADFHAIGVEGVEPK
jgi:hypothetical protein